MGAVLAACNEGVRKLLMPAAGSYTSEFTGFGEPESDCLLLIGSVRHATFSKDRSHAFFSEGLGAAPAQPSSAVVGFSAGPTSLALTTATEESQDASTWPGQLYVWVDNLQTSWDACRSLGCRLDTEVVESAVCCHDERTADALVLREPGSANVVIVNQAPKGYAKMLRRVLSMGPNDGAKSNLLCLMDVLCHVPRGSAARIASFYEQALSARVTRSSDGCRLHFACGEELRQSLSFAEEEGADDLWGPTAAKGRQVCLYVSSDAKFRLAWSKCSKAGLVKSPWKDVEGAGEFSFARCVDPISGEELLELSHVIRSPSHPECPLGHSSQHRSGKAAVGAAAGVDATAMGA
eukprot:gb/GFBE01069450.1/.p1 GENE.gb/GFBE01069450.1/~~gb/GFBE01069450.1/.p1  ORF type:complete len:350 (+),score=47.72 gb/GFBE01069450.1/:1-1050(+)